MYMRLVVAGLLLITSVVNSQDGCKCPIVEGAIKCNLDIKCSQINGDNSGHGFGGFEGNAHFVETASDHTADAK